MIRIDILSQSPDQAVMRVAGDVWLDYEINLVAQEGARCLETSKLLVLDLEHLHRLDEKALPLLKGWQAEGRLQISKHNYRLASKLQNAGLIQSEEGRP